jgi:phosphosulfolactate synthase
MMNFTMSQIPERTAKPRKSGLTMVMDKGLSFTEAENFLSVAGVHTDLIKLGFGTSFVTPNLRKKIELYQAHGIPVYFGGTLFEAFVIRDQFDDYAAICKDYKIDLIEVSDGSITIPHAEKCGYIEKIAKFATVLVKWVVKMQHILCLLTNGLN